MNLASCHSNTYWILMVRFQLQTIESYIYSSVSLLDQGFEKHSLCNNAQNKVIPVYYSDHDGAKVTIHLKYCDILTVSLFLVITRNVITFFHYFAYNIIFIYIFFNLSPFSYKKYGLWTQWRKESLLYFILTNHWFDSKWCVEFPYSISDSYAL